MRLTQLVILLLHYSLLGQPPNSALIPEPVKLELTRVECRLERAWKLHGTTQEELALVDLFGKELSILKPTYMTDTGPPLYIELTTIASDSLVPQGFHTIRVLRDSIVVASPTIDGSFLGTRTVIQVLET